MIAGHYAVYGVTLASDLALPELALVAPVDAPDVVIRTAPVDPPALAGHVDSGPSHLRFEIADVGRFEAREGRELRVDAAPGADPAQVRLYLLGSAMAAILIQRGRFALHASALEIDGAAVAFMGPSGAGKSTLAAWLVGQGAQLLSDDVCAVDTHTIGGPFALPGIPRLRLFEDSAEATGLANAATGEVRFDETWRKLIVPARPSTRPVPLRAAYLLDPAATGIQPIAGAEAAAILGENSYRGEFLPLVGDPQRHFDDLVSIVSTVRMFRFGRSAGFEEMNASNAALLEHIRGQRVG